MVHAQSITTVSVALLTVSDTRTLETDRSGDIAASLLESDGHTISSRELVADDMDSISLKVESFAIDQSVDVIVITGGTGPSMGDCTPEAILPMFESTLPGFGELFRQLSFIEIGSAAMLSRAEAGWIVQESRRTPVFLLPGSPKAVSLALEKLILPQIGHLIDLCRLDER